VFVDRASVEVFAQGGLACLTEQVFAANDGTGLAIYSLGGLTRIRALEWTLLRETPDTSTSVLASGSEPASVDEM
jgi:sucrose-6-phosphate hydrolase SacC (GH32 family)